MNIYPIWNNFKDRKQPVLCCIISIMWNIRMRASKKGGSKVTRSDEIHISGAEGIYEDHYIARIVEDYTNRALNHPKGRPDRIIITLEEIKQKPKLIKSLHVKTLKCGSPAEARVIIREFLSFLNISDAAIKSALRVLGSGHTMRGASLIRALSGRRVEPDMERGIRVSRLGISKTSDKILTLKLKHHGLNNTTVKEAIILASKVASFEQALAEVCVSDDPDYTTGYIASRKSGYIRIPHIKNKGNRRGGRVFFIEEDADVDSAITFLEKTPVMINKVSECNGIFKTDEIINSYNR
ncbi:MAG: 6-carboxyhexanoate--CoA ligase [Nitrospirota bacterium]